MNRSPPNARGRRIAAGAGGAGFGTVVTAIIQSQVPDTSPYKAVLLGLVPTISIASGGIVYAVYSECAKEIVRWRMQREHRRFHALVTARLADPHASEEHKQAVRKQFEAFDRQNLEAVVARFAALTRLEKTYDDETPRADR
jgi:hypothetical protein